MTSENLRERRLPGTIRTHDGMSLALVYRQRYAAQYLFAFDGCM